MKLYFVTTDKDYTKAYEVVAHNMDVKSNGEMFRGPNGLAYMEDKGKEIQLLTATHPERIEFDEKTESQLARYNLEQKNKTLVSEIAFHENKLSDIKNEFEKFNKALDEIKRIGKDIIDGHEYIRTEDYEDY